MLSLLPVALVALLLTPAVGCPTKSCSYQNLYRDPVSMPLACCGASASSIVSVTVDSAGVDLAFAGVTGAPETAHAWLTTVDCGQLFDGEYPPAGGKPVPRCTVYFGPVSPGQVSGRKQLPRGEYRVWVQAFTSAPAPIQAIVDLGVWGDVCNGPRYY
jgi:hypothetical protein